MNFILSLITFLLIVFGFVGAVTGSNKEEIYKRFDMSKLTVDKKKELDSLISKFYTKGILMIILGVGIIIARIFS